MTETSNKNEILSAIDKAISELAELMSSIHEDEVNSIPYKDSWTPGQLFSHVTKSINGMAGAMLKESKTAERDPGEKIEGLKKTFLDFSTRFKSPDFIVPGQGPYQKGTSIEELKQATARLKENTNNVSLNDLLTGLPIGEVTKLELLHFVLYHTQRHLNQMKNIVDAIHSSR